MVLWIVFAAMAALAVALVLRPLLAARAPEPARAAHEVAIGRDQLDELERDAERGLISEAEAREARAEIARRLIASSDAGAAAKARGEWRRPAAVFVIAAVPAIALGAYLAFGSPDMPAQPFAARQAAPAESQDLAMLVGRVESHLQENPGDASGWDVVAPAYMRLRRFTDAVDAFSRAIRLDGPTAERLSSLGEARVMAAQGMIDAGARQAFEQALALDGALVQPRYYLGLAAVQDGDVPGAIAIWEQLVASAPEGAPWVGEVSRQISAARQVTAGLNAPDPAEAPEAQEAPGSQDAATLPGPSAGDIEAASQLSAEDRAAMIEGMVSGLAERLGEEGGSVDEWVRLARAYAVLGREDDARAAIASAREAHSGDAAGLERLDQAAAALGLGS